MSATFETIINNIRTTTVGDLTGVIKHVGWTLRGTQDGQSFELFQVTELGPVDPENFIPLSEFTTSAQVVDWVEEATTDLDDIRGHIQHVLNKRCGVSTAVETLMPWAPVSEPTTL